MSIHLKVFQLKEKGELIELSPLTPGSPQVRTVLVTPAVMKEIDPATASSELKDAAAAVRARLDAFISGKQIVVGTDPRSTADLKRLSPGHKEVWAVRKGDKPQVRALGRFAGKDLLIVTEVKPRSFFDKIPGWDGAISRCRNEWGRLFGDLPPHTGSVIDDYVSRAIADSDL